MKCQKIGYQQLNYKEKKAYELFEKAFASYSNIIDISSIDKSIDIMKIFQSILGDNPQVFYVNKTQFKVSNNILGRKQLYFYSAYSLKQIKKMNIEINKAFKKVMEDLALLNPISTYDKLLCIYEYIQDNVTYNWKEAESCKKYNKSINYASHSIYGALVEKTAVCDGIAAVFAMMAQYMGFDCTIVNGLASFEATISSPHAWNIIRIGKKYYHLDVTWDMNHKQKTNEYSYEYFCVDDDLINIEHNWDINLTPGCNSNEMSFYIHNKCFANNLSQIDEIFLRYAKSKTKVVRIKISDRISIPEPDGEYIAQQLLNVGANVGKYGAIEFIWNKNTRCFYAKYK